MTEPLEALGRARDAAEAGRERGDYEEGAVSLEAGPVTRISDTKLAEWALINPPLDRVYSTRRFGAPITVAKRAVVRAIRQYLGEAAAQESRFNSLATAHILVLEERVRLLEEHLVRQSSDR